MNNEPQILARWVDPTIDDLKTALEEANKQINRLNNIITELENDLEKLVEESISRRKESKNAMEHSLNSAYIYAYMESLDKLKELKEGKE